MGRKNDQLLQEGGRSGEINKMLDDILSRNEEFKFDDAKVEMPTPAALVNDRQDQFLNYRAKDNDDVWNVDASETRIAMGLMLGFLICIICAVGLKRKRIDGQNNYARSRRNSAHAMNLSRV